MRRGCGCETANISSGSTMKSGWGRARECTVQSTVTGADSESRPSALEKLIPFAARERLRHYLNAALPQRAF
jgi:uncharacterized membrane protein YdbT with pleckstrin-like domain